MKENLKNKKLDVLQDKVMVVANKIAQQRHIRAISSGLMYIIPLSLLGAVFNILANPPITEALMQEGGLYASLFGGWYHFATTYREILTLPSNMTMGLISVVAVLGISYNLAKSYKMKEFSTSLVALIMFLLVAAPSVPAFLQSLIVEGVDFATLPVTNVLDTTYLGSSGLFVAIVIALLSTELSRFCYVKKLIIKMPDVVPPNVSESFSSVIPAFLNCIVFFGSNLLCTSTTGVALPAFINTILTPAISNVNTPLAIIAVITLGNLLWLFGIHGAALTSMLYIPISMQMTIANSEIVAQGGAALYQPVFLTQFANAYFGLTFLLLFAKSKQLKAIGKVGIIPGVFLISEPVLFGAPIMFNPFLAIPHLITPIITMTLAHIAYSIGLLQPDFNMIFAQLPLGLNAFFSSMSFQNLFFYFLMVVVQILCWYPFFKLYDKNLQKKEAEREQAEVEDKSLSHE